MELFRKNPGSLVQHNCTPFDSDADAARFGRDFFGAGESLGFALGAFFFGLGELFKLDLAKGYLLEGIVSFGFITFFVQSLNKDGLLSKYDDMIGKLKRCTGKYGKQLEELSTSLNNLQKDGLEAFAGPAKEFEAFAKKQSLAMLKPMVEAKIQDLGKR